MRRKHPHPKKVRTRITRKAIEEAKLVLKGEATTTRKVNRLPPQVGMYVTLHWNDTPAGSGFREWVVVREGRKYISLYSVPNLLMWQLPKGIWPTMGYVREVQTDRRFLISLLEEKVKQWQNLGLKFSMANARAAKKALCSYSAS